MDPLTRLSEERAVERLILDYAAWNDAGEWARLADAYLPDGRMSRPTAPDEFIEGAAAILAAFQARPPRAARHICANIRVDLDGPDRARATSQILLFTGPDQPPLVGTYHDRLVRIAAGWRFAERRGSLDFAKA